MVIEPAQAETSPIRNIILQALGPEPGDKTRRGYTSNYRAAAGIGVQTDEDAAETWAMNPYDDQTILYAFPGVTLGAMPVGLQLIGRPWSEGRLFELGRAYEAITADAPAWMKPAA